MVVDEPVAEVTPRQGAGAARAARSRDALRELADEYTRRAAVSSCGRSPAAGGSTPGPSTRRRRAVRPGRPAGPAHPGRAGDPGGRRLPPAGQPGPGLRGPRSELRRRDAHAARSAVWSRRRARNPRTGAILYRTTNYFLERMGLRGLDELPELAPFLPEAEAIEERDVSKRRAVVRSGDGRGRRARHRRRRHRPWQRAAPQQETRRGTRGGRPGGGRERGAGRARGAGVEARPGGRPRRDRPDGPGSAGPATAGRGGGARAAPRRSGGDAAPGDRRRRQGARRRAGPGPPGDPARPVRPVHRPRAGPRRRGRAQPCRTTTKTSPRPARRSRDTRPSARTASGCRRCWPGPAWELAARLRGADRRGPGRGQRPDRRRSAPGSTRTRTRSRSTACASPTQSYLSLRVNKPAGVVSTMEDPRGPPVPRRLRRQP